MSGLERNRGLRLPGAAAVALLVSCEAVTVTVPREAEGFSKAYGIWAPGASDSCTAEAHDAYSVVGPDGKLYPTWHPAIDPRTGCSFGHEHGRDPRGSDLYRSVGPVPFGVANEALDTYQPLSPRHEDHVGHKIEWANDVLMDFAEGAGVALEVRCDVLYKLHQGTHSKDAFTNNLHEVVLHAKCSDNTEVHVTMLTAIGKPGEFVVSCERERHVTVGPATPPTSPEGGGKRAIPDRTCIERHMLVGSGATSNYDAALRESWETSNTIRRTNGGSLAHLNPYFQVMEPSRFFDPSQPNNVGRPIAVCYEETVDGRRARGGACAQSVGEGGAQQGVAYDDPRSTFRGARRFIDVNNIRVTNADGPEIWYTDPFGRNAQTEPFPGSVRQFISRVDNTGRSGHGPAVGRDRNYGIGGVHAPN